jgi:hypothetical protein
LRLESNGKCKRISLKGFLTDSYYWAEVPNSVIADFIKRFSNHPASQLTESAPLIDYLGKLAKKGVESCDCIVINPANPKSKIVKEHGNIKIKAQLRSNGIPYPGNGVALNKRRVASRGHEKVGLDATEVDQVERPFIETKRSVPDWVYRKIRTRPLLMLHLLDCREKEKLLFEQGIVAYGISFPGEAGVRRPEDLVEYIVNPVWWSDKYGQTLEADEEVDFFWARDHLGRYLFIYRGDEGEKLPEKYPSLTGIEVSSVPERGTSRERLVLLLKDKKDWEIFLSLCRDLVASTKDLKARKAAPKIVLRRLNRWQEFLSKERSQLLSEREIKGLIGELGFLVDHVKPAHGIGQAVMYWQGPED